MTLPAGVETAILAHARRDAPNECCGLLLGRGETIVDAVAVRNAADQPSRRYLIDPTDHFTVIREARAKSLDVIGAYHSHPRSRALPSETDRRDGFAGFLFLIAGLAVDPPELTGWIWTDGNFAAVPLVRPL